MSYVITDGKRYCHRTKTRAVEIVNDLDSATRFANKDMAQNILQRATKKLSGFSLKELPSVSARETPAKAKTRKPAEKQESTEASVRETFVKEAEILNTEPKAAQETEAAQNNKPGESLPAKTRTRRGRNAGKNAETSSSEQQEKAAQSLNQAEEPAVEVSARTAQADGSEEKAGRSEPRKKTHRGGRRRKNASQETASPEQTVKAEENRPESSEAEPAGTGKQEENAGEKAGKAPVPAAAVSPVPVLPPSFRMEIRGGASNQKSSVKKELPETAAAPAVSGASDSAAAPSAETVSSEAASENTSERQDSAVQSEQNRSRKSGRSRRGGRKNRTDGKQQDTDNQNVNLQDEDKADVSVDKDRIKSVAPVTAVQEKAAAAPEKPAEPEKPVAPVIPKFTVKTHHVSENAVARTVRTEQAEKPAMQKEQAPAAVSGQPAQPEDDKPLVIETAHVADEPKAGQSTDNGRARSSGRNRSGRGGRSRDDQGRESSSSRESSRESADKKSASDTETKAGENSRSRAKGRSKSVSSTEAKRRIFTTQERYEIYNRTEGHCGICGKFIPLGEYTIDHIIPLSKGGTNDLDNLQACCSFCNKAKDDSIGDEFFQRIENIFLYQAQLKFGKKKLKKLKKALDEFDE